MGLFAFLSGRKSPRRTFDESSAARSRAAVETLEQRVLFAIQLDSPGFDVPGSVLTPKGTQVLADQAETTNVTFSPPGSNDRTVAAYNDGAMMQFGQVSGSPMHTTGWAYSDNGGASFVQPNSNPASPVLLPTVPNGAETTGDDANHSLAWGNANGALYMASTSSPTTTTSTSIDRPMVDRRSQAAWTPHPERRRTSVFRP